MKHLTRNCTLLLAFFLLFTNTVHVTAQSSPNNYKAPYFADSNRLQKLQAVFPLIEKMYRDHAQANHFPGYAFGVVLDGQLVFSGSGGYTDVAQQIPATIHSDFRIASMTKSFTAIAILKLRDEGKLSLDDPAYKYIPELKNIKPLTADAPVITVRNLLSHSAGFPEDNPSGDRHLADTEDELTAFIRQGISFSNVPGVEYEYSNLGFVLLGRIITNVSKQPFNDYITQHIMQPLGMNNTFWEYSKVPPQQLAHGYRWINNNWREEALLHQGSHASMGGIITTIEDFSKYVALHLAAWPPRNDAENNIIKRSSLREMHQPWRFSGLDANYKYASGRACPMASAYAFGLGWSSDCNGRVAIGHTGGLPGFGSNWKILPQYGLGVIFFANVTYAPTSNINTQILDTLVALSGIKPRQIPASIVLQQKQKALMNFLPQWKNAEQSPLFAVNFFLDFPIDSLRAKTQALFTKAGNIQNVEEVMPENQLRGNFIIHGTNANLNIYFTLTPAIDPQIQYFDIEEKK